MSTQGCKQITSIISYLESCQKINKKKYITIYLCSPVSILYSFAALIVIFSYVMKLILTALPHEMKSQQRQHVNNLI